MNKIVFAPAIAPAAWAIGESLLPEGFSIEVPSQDQNERVARGEAPLWVVPELRRP